MYSGNVYCLFLLLMCFCECLFGMSLGSLSNTACKSESDCVLLRDCKNFMNVVDKLEKPLQPAVVDFLREKQCGFQKGYPKVCCSEILLDEIPTKPTNNNHYKTCHEMEECIPLKDCKPYTELIATMKKPLKAGIVEFLRTQQCGFLDGYPKLCCSTQPKKFQVAKPSTPKPNDNFSVFEQAIEYIFETETTKKVSNRVKDNKKKSEAFNRAFAMANYFDLFRRRRRSVYNIQFDADIR